MKNFVQILRVVVPGSVRRFRAAASGPIAAATRRALASEWTYTGRARPQGVRRRQATPEADFAGPMAPPVAARLIGSAQAERPLTVTVTEGPHQGRRSEGP